MIQEVTSQTQSAAELNNEYERIINHFGDQPQQSNNIAMMMRLVEESRHQEAAKDAAARYDAQIELLIEKINQNTVRIVQEEL